MVDRYASDDTDFFDFQQNKYLNMSNGRFFVTL